MLDLIKSAASHIYGVGGFIHRKISSGKDAGIPVISVGNITAGGTGKTPMVLRLAELLGAGAAVVMRGYGRSTRGVRVVESPDPFLYGDEASLIKMKIPGISVIVSENRMRGAVAARAGGARAVILDDGFQSYEIKRSVDIVMIDCLDPFGGGRLIPLGRLREPLSSLGRASAAVLNRSDYVSPKELAMIKRTVGRYLNPDNIYEVRESAGLLRGLDGEPEYPPEYLKGKKVLGFCGIGNPEGFRRLLRKTGASSVDIISEKDHHIWQSAELESIRSSAEKEKMIPVTTEKDFVRLPEGLRVSGLMLSLVTVMEREEEFNEYILSKV